MLNKAILIGLVGKDPELKELNDGTKLCTFSLATSEYYYKGTEKQTKTEWHNITCFGKLAEKVNQYVSKGSKIYVEGKIKSSKYEKDGVKITNRYISVDNHGTVLFLDTSNKEKNNQTKPKETQTSMDDIDDEIPW